MARILIGWELGAHKGHIANIIRLSDMAVAHGHEVHLALQQVDAIGPVAGERRWTIWQAPVWPRLLVTKPQQPVSRVSTMGDILGRLGLRDQGALGSLILGWDAILNAVRPDVVIADFAPALLSASWGRLPTFAFGTGFSLPPTEMVSFPSLNGEAPGYDEAETLDIVDAELRSVGRDPLPALPALFRCTEAFPSTLPLLDPYQQRRRDPLYSPNVVPPLPEMAGAKGQGLFGYFPDSLPVDSPVWQMLAHTGLGVDLHIPQASEALRWHLSALGITWHARPWRFTRIAERAAAVVSHGGHGFVASAFVSGIPQIVIHYDLEKAGAASAVERSQVGLSFALSATSGATVGPEIARMVTDEDVRNRALAVAQDLRDLNMPDAFDAMLRKVEAM